MADCQVPLPCYQHSQEHGGAEAHVVEGVGELGDEVDPDQAAFGPGPGEFWSFIWIVCTVYDVTEELTSGQGIVDNGEDDEDGVNDGEGDEEAVKEIVCLQF